jgi:hypothetical protein
MSFKSRPRAFIVGLAVIMAIPVAAAAKPVSSFVLSMSSAAPGTLVSVVVEFDDLGVSHLGFSHTEFEVIACATGPGTVSTARVASGPAEESDIAVSRKLDDVAITVEAQVSKTVSTYCPETGMVEQSLTFTETFELQGVSEERLRRARVNGARVLSSTLDPLTLTTSELSLTGVGMLTETISK